MGPAFTAFLSRWRARFERLSESISHATFRLWPSRLLEDREKLLSSTLFDPEYYVQENPDVAAAKIDPATHYIRFGAFEARNPSAWFDAAAYLADHQDVREKSKNPLLHYLQYGQQEGRKVRRPAPRAPRPTAPDLAAWDALTTRLEKQTSDEPEIDIIIPVYKGLQETANCLYTVLSSRLVGKIPCEVVIINDQSPDPVLSDLLEKLAQRKLITLRCNNANLGFAATANLGIALHKQRDIILLNSDTEVYGDWVERLQRAAYVEKSIGTVTPFSNNATICGYPNFPEDFQGSFEISFDAIDRLASEANQGQIVDIPTGVGFCMFVRRACIDEVGSFDEKAFGRGYGEENDLCLRIAARGWRNVLAGDVFVRHFGSTSYTNSSERIKKGLQVVNLRYPKYAKEVHKFIREDPIKPLRRNIDILRLRRTHGAQRCVLFVIHNLGGGTLRYVQELSRLLAKEGMGALLMSPRYDNGAVCEITHPTLTTTSVVNCIVMKHDLLEAATIIRDLGVVLIHVNHFFGFSQEVIYFVSELARIAGIPYDFTVHDYTPICPRVNMIDASGLYCDTRSLAVCESCVKSHGSPFGDVSVWLWRRHYEQFLQGARKIFVPDEDVRERLKSFFPSLEVALRPHPEPVTDRLEPVVERVPGEILRVAVIGALGPHKGSRQLQQYAEDAARRRLPIKFILFGLTDNEAIADLPSVQVTGPYSDEYLPNLLLRGRCHLAFFPAVWPETYCYTLSHAFFSGLYPVAFDIGAIASRIRAAGWGRVLPFELIGSAHKLNEALLTCSVPPRPPNFAPVGGESLYPSIVADYYQL